MPPAGRKLPTALGELGDLAPVLFRWTTGGVEVRRTFELHLSNHHFAFAHALFGLVIEKLSFLRGTAQARDCLDGNGPLVRAVANFQSVAKADEAARSCTVVIYLNFTAGNRLRRQRPGLEEARGPKPLVESDLLVLCVVVHYSPLLKAN